MACLAMRRSTFLGQCFSIDTRAGTAKIIPRAPKRDTSYPNVFTRFPVPRRCHPTLRGILRPRPPPAAPLPWHHRRHPRTLRPDPQPGTTRLTRRTPTRLRRRGLPRPQRRRTLLQHRQAVARPGHPLRQARHRLPRRRRPPRHHHLAQAPLETRPRSRQGPRQRRAAWTRTRPRPE